MTSIHVNEQFNYFKVLGVKITDLSPTIKLSFRRKQVKHKNDKAMINKIGEAYEFLDNTFMRDSLRDVVISRM